MTTAVKSPREMARPFTPKLAELVEKPLFSDIWADSALSPRDRSLITVAALVCLNQPDELAAHLVRASKDGVTKTELSALITHMAFYAGFPSAISASAVAADVLGKL